MLTLCDLCGFYGKSISFDRVMLRRTFIYFLLKLECEGFEILQVNLIFKFYF